jgi:hypothetical protein
MVRRDQQRADCQRERRADEESLHQRAVHAGRILTGRCTTVLTDLSSQRA